MNEKGTVRVLVVDDAPEIRRLLCHRLPFFGRFEVVAEAADAEAGVAQAAVVQPDLVVLDLLMPGRSGLDAVADFHAAAPNCRILLYSAHDAVGPNASGIGVDAVVDKAERVDELETALEALFPTAFVVPSGR